ncbi:MAG: T9SS type B sorting domain-containing protein, partial [Allomuricauda sp.]
NINEITAVAEGGLEDYTFIFDGVDNGTDNTYIINRTDTYTVTVIDQNGCEVTMEIYMEFIDIEVPDFFTPDGDGMNDNWLPDNLEAFPNVLMIIFDRYGRELYRMRYGDAGWNGIYNNSELPTGDYWYIIKLQGENDDRELVGHFTLYRN